MPTVDELFGVKSATVSPDIKKKKPLCQHTNYSSSIIYFDI